MESNIHFDGSEIEIKSIVSDNHRPLALPMVDIKYPLAQKFWPVKFLLCPENCSDEPAVEELQANTYWQCFCGVTTVQKGEILDADLLHKVWRKIIQKVREIRKEVVFRKPFRTFPRVGKKVFFRVKKLYQKKPEAREEGIKKLHTMTAQVVRPADRIAKSRYAQGQKEIGHEVNRLVSLGRKVLTQTGCVDQDHCEKITFLA